MHAVIDTNVFVSACLGTGASNAVILACFRQEFVPLMGTALLSEYEDLLHCGDLFAECRLDERERKELLDIFVSHCEWIRVYYLWRPNLPDEADNHLVELAIAGGAEVIVTSNLRDLARMELRFPGLRVMSPEAFLKELK